MTRLKFQRKCFTENGWTSRFCGRNLKFVKTVCTILCFWAFLAFGDDKSAPASTADKHLVDVIFALDDKPTNQMFHIVVNFWISEKNKGMDRFVYNWAVQGGSSADSNTQEEATKCMKLLRVIDQPKNLPESPNEIVTVECVDGDKTLIKRFLISQVPTEVHEILTIMAVPDGAMKRLKFIQKNGQSIPNGKQPGSTNNAS